MDLIYNCIIVFNKTKDRALFCKRQKAFLSVFIDLLGPDRQLFYTTHNSDILDMDLPKHSFAFMRRNELGENKISCIYASAYLKKNTDSLKNAVENDLFSSAPNVERILGIKDT